MPDVAIVNSAIAAEPKDYTLTGTQELLLKSVRADIDGSGAGSAFLPALQLLAPDGTVMWQGVTSSTVAAGGSADVSWFPAVGAAPAASAGFLPMCAGRLFGGTTITIAPGATINIPWDEVTIPADSAASFTWPSGSNRLISVAGKGSVLYALTVSPDTDWPLAVNGVIEFFGTMATSDTSDVQTILAAHPPIDVFDNQAVPLSTPSSATSMGICVPTVSNGQWFAQVTNATAANFTISGSNTGFALVRLHDEIFP